MKNHHLNNRRFGNAKAWQPTRKPDSAYGRNQPTRHTSFTDRAKEHFAQIADLEPTFKDVALTEPRHPSCELDRGRLFGDGIEEARLIIEMLPAHHVEHFEMRHRSNESVVVAEVWRVSEEALDSIAAWKFSAGNDWGGPVEIERIEPLSRTDNDVCTDLFAALLANMTPEFATDKFASVVPVNGALGFPRRWTIKASFENAEELISCLPRDHIQQINLRLSETKVVLANVTQISKQGILALKAWENVDYSTDFEIVAGELHFLLQDEE